MITRTWAQFATRSRRCWRRPAWIAVAVIITLCTTAWAGLGGTPTDAAAVSAFTLVFVLLVACAGFTSVVWPDEFDDMGDMTW